MVKHVVAGVAPIRRCLLNHHIISSGVRARSIRNEHDSAKFQARLSPSYDLFPYDKLHYLPGGILAAEMVLCGKNLIAHKGILHKCYGKTACII